MLGGVRELERMNFVGVLLALTLQIQIQIGFRAKDEESIMKANGKLGFTGMYRDPNCPL